MYGNVRSEIVLNNSTLSHIAIIIDGNGRWAKEKNLKRTEGHYYGRKNFELFSEILNDMGIKYFTVYGFSTENWSRPPEEVAAIIALFKSYLEGCSQLSAKHNYRIKVIGSREGLSEDVIKAIEDVEAETSTKTGMTIQIAFNYGGRDEIVRSTKAIAQKVLTNEMAIDEINDQSFEAHLDTNGTPPPDIMIRTGGEIRLSNFLLWQLAYSELFFVDKYWPDFQKEDLDDIIKAYKNRDRRFGGIKNAK